MKRVDLHLHSNRSDGLPPPEEVIRLAAEAGLAAVALCDHDTVEGIGEAMEAGRRHKIEVLAGVELSTAHGEFNDLHLLGYGFNPHSPELLAALDDFREHRLRRSRRMLKGINAKLAEEGRPPLDPDQVEKLARGVVGRPHLGLLLMKKGYVQTMEEAFHRYLNPCNEPKRLLPTVEAIPLMHRAGGVAVIAHPLLLTRNMAALEGLFTELRPHGLDGIEVYTSSAAIHETEQLITLAGRLGLIVTGGSDFHGHNGGEISIGTGKGNLRIPYRVVEEIKKRLPQTR